MPVEEGTLFSKASGKSYSWYIRVTRTKGGTAEMPVQGAALAPGLPAPAAGVELAVDFERSASGHPEKIRRRGEPWQGQPPAAGPNPAGPVRLAAQANVQTKVVSQQDLANRNDYDVAELATCVGVTVQKDGSHKGKWFRPDYSSRRPGCYPYNFVAAPRGIPPVSSQILGGALPERLGSLLGAHPECDRSWFDPKLNTGSIEVVLTVLSPTIVSHPPGADDRLPQAERVARDQVLQRAFAGDWGLAKIQQENRSWTREALQRVRPPAFDGSRFFIPSSSLKGMLRAVVESLTNSRSPFVTPDLEGQDRDALAHRIGRWRDPRSSAAKIAGVADLSQYTYGFRSVGGFRTWTRWVRRDETPFALLSHVDAERHPGATTLADRMFGRVAGSGWPSLAGRVRVGTAIGADAAGNETAKAADDYWFLRPLTSPAGAKARCEALYLKPTVGPAGSSVANYGTPQAEFRGRKRYWPHSLGGPLNPGAQPLSVVRDRIAAAAPGGAPWADPGLMQAVGAFRQRVEGHKASQPDTKSWLKPLLPGSRFRFRIDFTNLTATETGALLKALLLFNEADGDFATATHVHRLGRAKPLGFGSVVLSIASFRLRDVETAYGSLVPVNQAWFGPEDVRQRRQAATEALDGFCNAWKSPVWDQLGKLAAIPTALTDYDYWKNWSDFDPASAVPLPLP